jgi:hypothetical protein
MKNNIPKEEPKQEYEYIGECNGNNDNGCFLDSCGHDCGCFTRVLKQSKQETFEEVECNNCGYLMSLTEDESVYACYNSECTSCYEEYEEEPNLTDEKGRPMTYWGGLAETNQDKRMYSEEEVEVIAKDAYIMGRNNILIGVFNKWFEQFKKK